MFKKFPVYKCRNSVFTWKTSCPHGSIRIITVQFSSNAWFVIACVSLSFLQTLRSELKEREHLVVSTLDQARMFLADQPIEGPGEPRKNLQPKTGAFVLS